MRALMQSRVNAMKPDGVVPTPLHSDNSHDGYGSGEGVNPLNTHSGHQSRVMSKVNKNFRSFSHLLDLEEMPGTRDWRRNFKSVMTETPYPQLIALFYARIREYLGDEKVENSEDSKENFNIHDYLSARELHRQMKIHEFAKEAERRYPRRARRSPQRYSQSPRARIGSLPHSSAVYGVHASLGQPGTLPRDNQHSRDTNGSLPISSFLSEKGAAFREARLALENDESNSMLHSQHEIAGRALLGDDAWESLHPPSKRVKLHSSPKDDDPEKKPHTETAIFHRFMDLPQEIREMIYKILVGYGRAIDAVPCRTRHGQTSHCGQIRVPKNNIGDNVHKLRFFVAPWWIRLEDGSEKRILPEHTDVYDSLAITRATKQLRLESLKIFYTENTFTLNTFTRMFMAKLESHNRLQMLTNVHFYIYKRPLEHADKVASEIKHLIRNENHDNTKHHLTMDESTTFMVLRHLALSDPDNWNGGMNVTLETPYPEDFTRTEGPFMYGTKTVSYNPFQWFVIAAKECGFKINFVKGEERMLGESGRDLTFTRRRNRDKTGNGQVYRVPDEVLKKTWVMNTNTEEPGPVKIGSWMCDYHMDFSSVCLNERYPPTQPAQTRSG